MKTFIISGCSSGIGEATTKKLLNNGYKVIGISYNRQKTFDHPNFISLSIDLTKTMQIETLLKPLITSCENSFQGYIACAAKGLFGNIEQLSLKDIEANIRLNFLSHVAICKLVIPYLKKKQMGNIIFLGSEASLKGAQKGSIYCSTKFALRGFSQSIKEECRKSNVCVTIINPGSVKTSFFDTLDFKHGDSPLNYIDKEEIASLIHNIISSKHPCIYDEINLEPIKKVIKKK